MIIKQCLQRVQEGTQSAFIYEEPQLVNVAKNALWVEPAASLNHQ